MGVGVAARFDDPQDLRPEAPDGGPGLGDRLDVLDRIVEERGDGLVLIGPMLEGDGARPEQVRDVGDIGALKVLGQAGAARV